MNVSAGAWQMYGGEGALDCPDFPNYTAAV